MNEFEIISVNISEKKGTIKKTIETALVNKLGIEGDAHAALWHRQISLLPVESIEKFSNITGRAFKYGEFAENITTKGISLRDTSILDILKIGDVVLEITQIGKLCHGNKCSIYTQVGNCIMPEEGIFCRVITPGLISVGMKGIWLPKVFRVKVITVSDRAYAGIYEDLSGPAIKNYLSSFFMDAKRKVVVDNILVPDDEEKLSKVLK
ncbi:MAG TPA: hypothetical protein P5250_06600, partial [Bacteroidales bacterium]|nr:hypothetical protein [Bacteroidales bacterium]